MGSIPFISDALDVLMRTLEMLPGWAKLVIFLLLFPVIIGLLLNAYFFFSPYTCDTNGAVYTITKSTEMANLNEMRDSITGNTIFNTTTMVRQKQITKNWIAVDGWVCSIMNDKCMNWTAGRMLNYSEFISAHGYPDYIALYATKCLPYEPRDYEYENISIVFYNATSYGDAECTILYYAPITSNENLKAYYNEAVNESGIRFNQSSLASQIFPITCDASTITPRLTLLKIPIFSDFRIMIMLYLVYFLGTVFISIKAAS